MESRWLSSNKSAATPDGGDMDGYSRNLQHMNDSLQDLQSDIQRLAQQQSQIQQMMNHSNQQPGMPHNRQQQQQQQMQQLPMHQQQQQHHPMDPQPFYIAQDAHHQQPQQQPPRRTWGQPQPISFATTAGPEPYSPQRRQQWGARPYGGGYADPYGGPQLQQQPYGGSGGGPNYGSPYDRSPYGQQPGPPMGQPYGGGGGPYGQQPPMQPISPYGGQSAAAYMQSPPMHLPQSASIVPPAAAPQPPGPAPFRLHDSGGGAASTPLSRTTSAGGFGSSPSAGAGPSVTSPIRRVSEGPMYADQQQQQQSDFAARQSARESTMSPGGRRLHSSVPAPQVIDEVMWLCHDFNLNAMKCKLSKRGTRD